MNRQGKIHALLATSRVANVPSVVVNVATGAVIGMLHRADAFAEIRPGKILLPIAAGVLLYIAGNFLNDWMDRAWDATRRPERALPRGLFQSGQYLGTALLLGVGGIAAAWLAAPAAAVPAAAIAISIVIYTIVHKRTAWGVVPMGLCRALLPVLGCMPFFPYIDAVWPAAAALFCYIAGLSLVARYESMAEPPEWVAAAGRMLLLAPAIFMAWALRDYYTGRWAGVAGAIPYLAWTSWCLRFRRRPVPKLVSGLLAGIPLVDGMLLFPIALSSGGALSGDPFGLACLLLPPAAFAAALLLQRVAPAT